MRRALFLSLALTFALGARAVAQTCTGMPSFSAGQMQVTAGGSFADGASSFGGTFGYGVPKSFYGKAALGSTSYDGLDGSSLDIGVNGGYQIALKSSRPVQVLASTASCRNRYEFRSWRSPSPSRGSLPSCLPRRIRSRVSSGS